MSVGETVRDALQATEGQAPEVKAAVAAAAAGAAVPAPSLPSDIGFLWKALVVGLLAVLVISLGGIIYTVADANDRTSPDVIVTIFSSALTGLIGLFVRSPTQR
jgi:hypothetical protein